MTLQSKVCKVFHLVLRHFSTVTPNPNIRKSVLISQSTDIYTNLALEDWLYRNYNFNYHQIMMLWRNDPCVVIGRHQNPWLEANIPDLNATKLARRNSGGGTVYHDQGNLNITFFTSREQYNRKCNLELITRAIFYEYNIKVDISPREDLCINSAKLSGTAAKLGEPNAYHHCTLLVDANKANLSNALHKTEYGMKTNATRSVKSPIINLCELNPKIDIENLLFAIGREYMNASEIKENSFQIITPDEQHFPGLIEIRNTLRDWEWCYGKTPRFTITKSFSIPGQFVGNFNAISENLKVTIKVEHCRISDVILSLPSGDVKVTTSLIGQKFTEDVINLLEGPLDGGEYGLVDECIRQVVTT